MTKKIDLKRYMGTWEQVSVNPVPRFQKGCNDIKAVYTLRDDGRVDVLNICDNRDIKGVAKSVSEDNRHLKVSFFPFVWSDYKIAFIDSDYKNAIVKSDKYVWQLKKIMEEKKYDPLGK